jgi:hypothetical protein
MNFSPNFVETAPSKIRLRTNVNTPKKPVNDLGINANLLNINIAKKSRSKPIVQFVLIKISIFNKKHTKM